NGTNGVTGVRAPFVSPRLPRRGGVGEIGTPSRRPLAVGSCSRSRPLPRAGRRPATRTRPLRSSPFAPLLRLSIRFLRPLRSLLFHGDAVDTQREVTAVPASPRAAGNKELRGLQHHAAAGALEGVARNRHGLITAAGQ